MEIYLAARWAHRLDLHPMRKQINEMGHNVTSQWLDEAVDTNPVSAAQRDIEDIDRADTLILWHNLQLPILNSLYGGLFVEFGYALATGKQLWVVDDTPYSCIFLMLPNVRHFPNWASCFAQLKELKGLIKV